MDLQCFTVVALAMADFAGHIDIGQEVHFDLDDTLTPTGFTAPAFDVEGEAPRLVTSNARLWHMGKEFADTCEGVGIGRRVGARRTPNRRLIDINYLIQILQARN